MPKLETRSFAPVAVKVSEKILVERVFEDTFGDLCIALDVEHQPGEHRRMVFSWDEQKGMAERSDASGPVHGKYFIAARNLAKDILRAAARKRRSED
jgi:hypothetical protein